jgi:hypothetical protein
LNFLYPSDKGFGGDVLWDKITAAAQNNLRRERIGCFAAGTLVHTREGLRPIEDIQVGDWVLSKPESGGGECEYKRVTETFVFEDREVFVVEASALEEPIDVSRVGSVEYFVVTPVHPLWLAGFDDEDPELLAECYGLDASMRGWMSVGELSKVEKNSPGVLVQLGNQIKARFTSYPLVQTESPLIAKMVTESLGQYRREPAVRFDGPSPVVGEEGARHKNEGEDEYGVPRLVPYRCTVYNLTVEDHHTYFVGRNGLWVHNKNPDDLPSLTPTPFDTAALAQQKRNFRKVRGPLIIPAGPGHEAAFIRTLQGPEKLGYAVLPDISDPGQSFFYYEFQKKFHGAMWDQSTQVKPQHGLKLI